MLAAQLYIRPHGDDLVCSINKAECEGNKQENVMVQQPKKLPDQVRDVIRCKHYAYRTEAAYDSVYPLHDPPPAKAAWPEGGLIEATTWKYTSGLGLYLRGYLGDVDGR